MYQKLTFIWLISQLALDQMHIGPPDMGLKLVSGRMADQGEVEPGAGRVLHADTLLVRHPAVQAPAHL